jgi:hypothetical protein
MEKGKCKEEPSTQKLWIERNEDMKRKAETVTERNRDVTERSCDRTERQDTNGKNLYVLPMAKRKGIQLRLIISVRS